jgi:hypothetical protein
MKAANLSKIVANKKYSKNASKIHPLNENEKHAKESNAPKSFKNSKNQSLAIVNAIADSKLNLPTYVYEVTQQKLCPY